MNPHDFKIGAFMVVQGATHERMADITQPRAECAIRLPIQRIQPEGDPYLAKLRIIEQVKDKFDHVFLIDTDIVFHSWDWSQVRPHHFNGVHTWHESWPQTREMRKLIPEPWPLCNSGLWITPTTIGAAMQEAHALASSGFRQDYVCFEDETPLNLALYRHQVPMNALPTGFNFLQNDPVPLGPVPAPGLHAVHFTSPKNKLLRVARYNAAYPFKFSGPTHNEKEFLMQRRDDTLYAYMQEVRKSASNKKSWTWLDLGAGRGQVSQMLSKILKSNKYHCIDVASYHKVVKAYDGRNIPFGSGTFDFVLCNFVLHHTGDNLEKLLSEARRVLKPEGFLVIQEDMLDGSKVTTDLCYEHAPHGRFFTLRGWKKKLRSCGFAVNTIRDLPAVLEDVGDYVIPRALLVANISPLPPPQVIDVKKPQIPPQPNVEGSPSPLIGAPNDPSPTSDIPA